MKRLLVPLMIIINLKTLEVPHRTATPAFGRHETDLTIDIPNYGRSPRDQSPSRSPHSQSSEERETKCNCNSNCSTDTKIIIATVSSLATAITTITIILVKYYG